MKKNLLCEYLFKWKNECLDKEKWIIKNNLNKSFMQFLSGSLIVVLIFKNPHLFDLVVSLNAALKYTICMYNFLHVK